MFDHGSRSSISSDKVVQLRSHAIKRATITCMSQVRAKRTQNPVSYSKLNKDWAEMRRDIRWMHVQRQQEIGLGVENYSGKDSEECAYLNWTENLNEWGSPL